MRTVLYLWPSSPHHLQPWCKHGKNIREIWIEGNCAKYLTNTQCCQGHQKQEHFGVPVVAQRKRIWLGTIKLQVRSLALLRLRIQHCRELWCSWQMWLASGVAVALALLWLWCRLEKRTFREIITSKRSLQRYGDELRCCFLDGMLEQQEKEHSYIDLENKLMVTKGERYREEWT